MLTAWSSVASAHLCGSPARYEFSTNDIGQTFYYYIYSDVFFESEPSQYSVTANLSNNVAFVEVVNPASYFFGLYRIIPLAEGATAVNLQWEYPPNFAAGFCQLQIRVGDEAIAGYPAADIVDDVDILDPVNAGSGELTQGPVLDFDLGGPMPLQFYRYYASKMNLDGRVGSLLKQNWSHNFDTRASVLSNRVEITTYTGRRFLFDKSGSDWIPAAPQVLPYHLTEQGSVFTLSDPSDHRLYSFSTNGNMIAIADGKGNVHTLSYIDFRLEQVSDGLGRSLTFAYEGDNELAHVTDGIRTNVYGYANMPVTPFPPILTQATDARGNTTVYQYEHTSGNGVLMTNWVHPEGNAPFVQTYNTNHQVILQSSQGHSYGMGYEDDLTRVTNPIGGVVTFQFNDRRELIARTDEDGLTTTVEYDAQQRLVRITDRQGHPLSLGYDPASGLINTLSNAMSQTSTATYQSRMSGSNVVFDLSTIQRPDGSTEGFGYDALGNLTVYTNPLGAASTFTYNGNGQVLVITLPTGGAITNAYHPDGTLATAAGSGIGPSVYEYDDLFRLTNALFSDGSTFSYDYDANNNVVRQLDGRGNETLHRYDGNNNLTQSVDAAGQSLTYMYDELDRVVRETDRAGQSTTYTYDERNLLAVSTNRNGHATYFGYSPRGNVTGLLDPESNLWTFVYDAEERVTDLINPLGQPIVLEYDPLGNLIELADPLGHTVHVEYDAMQRVIRTEDALSRTRHFAYDLAGSLTSVTHMVVGSAAYERNTLGLLTNVTDLAGNDWRFGYTPPGRTAHITDPLSQSTAFEYDSMNRSALITYPDGSTASNTYDSAGNRIRRQYADGTDLTFGYDSLNHITNYDGVAITRDVRGLIAGTQDQGISFGAGYDAGTRLSTVTYNNGAFTVSYTYDGNNRLMHVGDTLTGKGMDFTYDSAGRLTGIARSNGVDAVFVYDDAGRQVHREETGIIDIEYTYDAADQIIEADMTVPLDPTDLVAASSSTFTYDAASQASSPGYDYDARGRVTNLVGQAVTWDDAERLRQVNGVQLTYRGLSSLASRDMGGVGTNFYYNYAIGPRQIMAEQDIVSGQFQRYYIWAPDGRLLYGIHAQSGQIFYYHFDITGHTLALSDDGGGITDTYAYSIYGSLLGSTGSNPQPYTFVGRDGVRTEPAIPGLYHMGTRYYHSDAKQFLSREALWPDLGNPQLLNPYQYALNSPVQTIDPSGNRPRKCYGGTSRVEPEFQGLSTAVFAERLRRLKRPLNTDGLHVRGRSRLTTKDPSFKGLPKFSLKIAVTATASGKDFHISDGRPSFGSSFAPPPAPINLKSFGTSISGGPPLPFGRIHLPTLDQSNDDAYSGDLDGYLLIGKGGDIDGSYLPRNYDNGSGANADLPIQREYYPDSDLLKVFPVPDSLDPPAKHQGLDVHSVRDEVQGVIPLS